MDDGFHRSTDSGRRFQFELGSMFYLLTVISVCFAAGVWLGPIGMFFAVVAIVLTGWLASLLQIGLQAKFLMFLALIGFCAIGLRLGAGWAVFVLLAAFLAWLVPESSTHRRRLKVFIVILLCCLASYTLRSTIP
ncbi:MAG: hypothetical protein WD278_15995 [Pirellulales bacterium]